MTKLRPETAAAVDAVERGLALATGGAPGRVSSKGKLDVVTEADVSVEDLIRSALRERSGVPVVGEERGGEVPEGGAYWMVDPICGTRNFASGIPLYSVNVALVEDGEVSIGVAGDPSTGGVHVAERGRKAWVRRDDVTAPLIASDDSETVVVETGRAEGERLAAAARYSAAAISAARWELRGLSTTLALPYVAAGRVAAYVLFYGSALHTGAGTLIAAEAGAVVTDVEGRPWTIRSDSVLAAATPRLHEDLLALHAP